MMEAQGKRGTALGSPFGTGLSGEDPPGTARGDVSAIKNYCNGVFAAFQRFMFKSGQ